MTPQDIVREFLHIYHAEGHSSYDGLTLADGTGIYLYCAIDLDYHVGYMLRVSTGKSHSTVQYLASYVRHGGVPTDDDIDVMWLSEPEDFFGSGTTLPDAVQRFAAWAFLPERQDEHGWSDRQNAKVMAQTKAGILTAVDLHAGRITRDEAIAQIAEASPLDRAETLLDWFLGHAQFDEWLVEFADVAGRDEAWEARMQRDAEAADAEYKAFRQGRIDRLAHMLANEREGYQDATPKDYDFTRATRFIEGEQT